MPITSHELARRLLAGPDKPVEINVRGYFADDGQEWDSVWGAYEEHEDKDHTIAIIGYVPPDDPS